MKAKFLTLTFFFIGMIGFAQDTIPPYKKNPTLPDFTIQLLNTNWFTQKQLPANSFTIIVYFNPDCKHCQYEATELVKYKDSLKNAFFVWVSYQPMKEIDAFAKKYKLLTLKNLTIGRDPQYAIPSFYQVKFVPYVAVYDKKKQLVNTFEGGIEMPDLLEVLRTHKP